MAKDYLNVNIKVLDYWAQDDYKKGMMGYVLMEVNGCLKLIEKKLGGNK